MVLFFLDVVQYASKNFDVQMYFIQHSSAQHGCIRASVFLSVTKEKELKGIFLKEFSRFFKINFTFKCILLFFDAIPYELK